MGIITDDGTHELHLASVFADGTRGGGYRGVGADAQVESSWAPDGTSLPESRRSWRPAADVVAFGVTCDCSVPGLHRSTSTVLARWERVPERQLEDLELGRLFVPVGEDAMDASDRPDVEAAMRLWSEHLGPAGCDHGIAGRVGTASAGSGRRRRGGPVGSCRWPVVGGTSVARTG